MNYQRFSRAASAALTVIIVILMSAPGAGAQGKYKTLYAFAGPDGNRPFGTLTFDAAGDLYGITYLGGAYGAGVVFKLAPNQDGSWTESTLYDFTGGTDGSNPVGGVIFDTASNLYGVTFYGGAQGAGVVFELTPNADGSWTQAVIYTFTGGTDGANPLCSLIFDAQGSLYGTVVYDAAKGWGGVFKLTPNTDGSWVESMLYAFTGGMDGGHPTGGLIFDSAGTLYGTTYWGGSGGCVNRCGTAFKLAPNQDGSWTGTVLHRFTGVWDGANPSGNLTFDAAGNLYGSTNWGSFEQGCGSTCGTIFQLAPKAGGGWTTHILHSFTGGKDGGACNDECTPAFDTAGNLYGMRTSGGSLGYGVGFKLAPTSAGGVKYTALSFNDRPGADPGGSLVFDAAGNLYSITKGDGSKTFGSVFEFSQ